MTTHQLIQVGEWKVNFDELTLQKEQVSHKVDYKVMLLLQYLVSNQGKILSREQLMSNVWPDQIVSDDALNVAISTLRKLLQDNTRDPRYIKTIPRKGYQLVASVSEVPNDNLKNTKPIKVPLGISFIVALLVVTLVYFWPQTTSTNSVSRLAVLPFDYYSSVGNKEYIADGMTEAIINRLVQEPQLLVTSRTSIMQYKNEKPKMSQVAEQLNVEWVLEGSVQIENNRIQVTAQLINAKTDQHVWSDTYQSKLNDVFEIQANIASQIAHRFSQEKPRPSELSRPLRDVSPVAYDTYLQARFFEESREFEQAQSHYEKAIAIDESFALAHAKLSHLLFRRAYFSQNSTSDLLHQASLQANKAHSLMPQLPEVQLAMALHHMYIKHAYSSAEQAFQKAYKGNHQDLMTMEWYLKYLTMVEDFEKAHEVVRHMITVSPLAYNKLSKYQLLYYQRNYPQALAEIELKSPFISEAYRESLYAWTYLASRDEEGIRQHLPLMLKKFAFEPEKQETAISMLNDGNIDDTLVFLARHLTNLSDYDKAELYAWAGLKRKATDILEQLVKQGDMKTLRIAIEPSFQSLSNEPRFHQLIQQLNLGSI